MMTLKQQFTAAVAHAVRVLRHNPERYAFKETFIPAVGECGCLLGLIGEGAGVKPGQTIDAALTHFGLHKDADADLYNAMDDATRAPGRSALAWQDDAAVAALVLRKAAADLRVQIPRGRRVS